MIEAMRDRGDRKGEWEVYFMGRGRGLIGSSVLLSSSEGDRSCRGQGVA